MWQIGIKKVFFLPNHRILTSFWPIRRKSNSFLPNLGTWKPNFDQFLTWKLKYLAMINQKPNLEIKKLKRFDKLGQKWLNYVFFTIFWSKGQKKSIFKTFIFTLRRILTNCDLRNAKFEKLRSEKPKFGTRNPNFDLFFYEKDRKVVFLKLFFALTKNFDKLWP